MTVGQVNEEDSFLFFSKSFWLAVDGFAIQTTTLETTTLEYTTLPLQYSTINICHLSNYNKHYNLQNDL